MKNSPSHTKPHPKSKNVKGKCSHCGLKYKDVHLCPRGFYDAHWKDKK